MKSATIKGLWRVASLAALVLFASRTVAQTGFFTAFADGLPSATSASTLPTQKFQINAAKFREAAPVANGEASSQERMRRFLEKSGFSFPTTSVASDEVWTRQGNAFFYNERLGALWVRASKADLAKIGVLVRAFLAPPPQFDPSGAQPQVNLTARFVEFSDQDSKMSAMGRFFLGNFSPYKITTNTNPIYIKVLTEPQSRVFLNAIENNGGPDVITAPPVFTISGRQARLNVENPKSQLSPQTPPPLPRDTSPDADPTPASLFQQHTLKIRGL